VNAKTPKSLKPSGFFLPTPHEALVAFGHAEIRESVIEERKSTHKDK